MKKKYEKPELEVIRLTLTDRIMDVNIGDDLSGSIDVEDWEEW